MHVEECCLALLEYSLPRVDSERKGICIDVGVGSFAFYCEMFSRLGFRTAAVEPLPTKRLQRVCKHHGVSLVESCLSEQDGLETLHIGSYQGRENVNLSSLHRNWWGSSSESVEVHSQTLHTLLSLLNPVAITCLKVDVEGAESRIISQLRVLQRGLLPKVVMFEYGGGDVRSSGSGGWSNEFLKGTIRCLHVLRELEYCSTVIVDSAPDTVERILDLTSSSLEPDDLFYSQAVYGNIIAFRHTLTWMSELVEICSFYRDNSSSPSPPMLLRNPISALIRGMGGFIRQ
jgi:FkbM family methyltransferase